ncbi:hypothetical protein MMC29_000902 [Sticta canariensis]|nr:hypothetical protein [Sticta canariensis]
MTSYLVTGASRGIGSELVSQLSQQSSTSVVYAGVRNPSAAPETFSSNPKIHIIQLDVLRQSDVDAAAETIRKHTGSLDVLISNAGTGTGVFLAKCSTELIQENLEINTVAPHRLIQAFLPLVRAGVQKKIVAIGSDAGSFGLFRPLAQQGAVSGAYGISKASLHFMLMHYAAELTLAEGILFASVDPGVVDTTGARDFLNLSPGSLEKLEEGGFHMTSPQESAEGILKVVEGLTKERSGDFLVWNEGVLQVQPY